MNHTIGRSLLALSIVFSTCFSASAHGQFTANEVWSLDETPSIGWEGSPAYCDLNGDNQVEAIVPVAISSGLEDSTLQAIDPRTGQRLFQTVGGEGGFGYPLCMDVNADGVLDIITGGHIGDVYALSGVDGSRLWTFSDTHADAISGHTFSPVASPEHSDFFFITTGGASDNLPNNQRNPGAILVIDKSGALIAKWDEPAQREIYDSPAVFAVEIENNPGGDDVIYLAIGTGGETLPGELYILLYNTESQQFSQIAAKPSACNNAGFVSSPTIGDISGDGVPDIVAADICGAVHAYSLDGVQLWQSQQAFDFSISNPLLTDLDGDTVYDVVVTSIQPNLSIPPTLQFQNTVVTAFRGTDGHQLWVTPIDDLMVLSSPAAADLDQDGVEDIWLVTSRLALESPGFSIPTRASYLLALSGINGSELLRYENANWVGSPLVGDANNNGLIDVLLIDAPVTFVTDSPQNPGTRFPHPSQTRFLEVPGSVFNGVSFSGFRGPGHDGHRP